jgi:hypothetical protein
LITVPVPTGTYKAFLLYLYSGSVNITTSNVLALLHLADHYDLPALLLKCTELVSEAISVDTVLDLWSSAESLAQGDLVAECFMFTQENTSNVLKSSNSPHVTVEMLQKILDSLDINEAELFRFFLTWMDCHKPSMDTVFSSSLRSGFLL